MIYVVQAEHGGPVKIGYTENPSERVPRLRHIQNGYPYTLVVRHFGKGSRADEMALHREFAAYRMRGEWFQPAALIAHKFPAVIVSSRASLDLDAYAAARADGATDAAIAGEANLKARVRDEIPFAVDGYKRLRRLNLLHGRLLKDLVLRLDPAVRSEHVLWLQDRYVAIVGAGGSWPGWVTELLRNERNTPPTFGLGSHVHSADDALEAKSA